MSKLTSLFFTMVFTVLVVGNAQGQIFLKNKNPDVIWVAYSQEVDCPGSSSSNEKVIDRALVRARIKGLKIDTPEASQNVMFGGFSDFVELEGGGIGRIPSLMGGTGISIGVMCLPGIPLAGERGLAYSVYITGGFSKMVYYSETETGRPSESGVLDFGSDNKGNIGGAYRHMVVPKDTAEEKIAAQVGTLIEELITLYLKANHDL